MMRSAPDMKHPVDRDGDDHLCLSVPGGTGAPKAPPPPISIQSELGDVVYVEVPEVGASLSKGANLGVVESVKVRTHERHVPGIPSLRAPVLFSDPPLNPSLDPSHRRPATSTLPSVAR